MPEKTEFITHFEVSNFKKFDHLVVEDIGQFNLITGDNNVGKTSLLEALMVNKNPHRTFFIYRVLRDKRGFNDVFITRSLYDSEEGKEITFKENFFAKYQANFLIPTEFVINNEKIKILNLLSKILDTSTNDKGVFASVEIEKFVKRTNFFGNPSINQNSSNWLLFFVDNELIYIKDISPYSEEINGKLVDRSLPIVYINDDIEEEFFWTFGKVFTDTLDKKRKVIDLLNTIFNNIQITDVSHGYPPYKTIGYNRKEEINISVSTHDNPKFHSIRNYGDGVIRVFHIISLIYSGFDKIYIDEIDTGIHFSRMKDFWVKIITLCKDLKIQLFATTHSQECIEAYAQALEELETEDIGRLITLKEKNGVVFANTKNYEVIKYGIENGYNGLG